MGFRVQIWSGGALWNPLSFLIKDSIQSNLWTGKESSLLKIQLVKNRNDFIINPGGYISVCSLHRIIYSLACRARFFAGQGVSETNLQCGAVLRPDRHQGRRSSIEGTPHLMVSIPCQ